MERDLDGFEPDGQDTDSPTGPWVLIGLDGEMSSADIDTGGRLIQAGAAAWTGEPGGPVEVFTSLLRPADLALMDWSERAAQVHQLTRDQVAAAPLEAGVDDALYDWLVAHGGIPGRRILIPVGLNVAVFDMPFFRQALPRSASLFARRAVDLNALLFTYAGWDPNPRASAERDFAGWKRSMKTAANTLLARSGMPVREHDAGFDAAQALVGWWWLRSQAVETTRQLQAVTAELEAADPIRATLGAGLTARLADVPRATLVQILDALPAGTPPRRWFGAPLAVLGCSPLAAIQAGRLDELAAWATARAAEGRG